MIVHYHGWSWDQMYFNPGQYVGGSRSSIGVHMRLGWVRVHVREVQDRYVTHTVLNHFSMVLNDHKGWSFSSAHLANCSYNLTHSFFPAGNNSSMRFSIAMRSCSLQCAAP